MNEFIVKLKKNVINENMSRKNILGMCEYVYEKFALYHRFPLCTKIM